MLGRFPFLAALMFLAIVALSAQPILAQAGGDDDLSSAAGGVKIDAEGFLSARAKVDPSGALTMRRLKEARVNVNQELQKPSKLRKVSLVRLEKQVRKLLDAGEPIPDDMQYLAGLTRITHVFYYPETDDIVVAGPAEGYFRAGNGHVVGMSTGSAVLQLQDMIVALRAFGPDNNTRVISVSIDPTQEGLRNLNNAKRRTRSTNPNQAMDIARFYRDALGYQEITIKGVSPNTHFAQVLAEADYNMKLIGIGLERPQVGITSFLEVATVRSAATMQRWFFQPNYNSVTVAEDSLAMELTGSAVQLLGENETVSKQGKRTRTGKLNKASQKFTSSFTRAYDKLAQVSPIYGELRNVMDLSIAAAFIQKMGLYEKAGWSMDSFGDESIVSVERFRAPQKVDAVLNAVWRGSTLLPAIAGGVTIQPRVCLNSDKVTVDTEGKINEVKSSIVFDKLQDGQWWWD